MRICHLTSVHSHNDTRIFIKECRFLARNGFDVHYIVPIAPHENVDGIWLHGVPSFSKNRFLRMTITVFDVCKKALEIDADIYHFHDPELIPVGLILKFREKKVIYDVHEDVPRQIMSKDWIPKPYRKIVSWIFERIENWASKRFDGIVVATPFITRRFKRLQENVINVNNYPLLDELFSEELERHHPTYDKYVCYIGGISKVRGIVEMVQAVAKTDAKLLLGGNFSNSQLRHQLTNMSEWKNVVELGFLNREQVKDTLRKAVAGLVVFHPEPNHINAQPNKMFEYMSAGIPVIASNFPLWKEIVEGNECGICVNPLDPDEIAQAIQYILDNPKVAKKMGENGRKAVEEKYNWETESKKLVQFYNEIIKN